MTVEMLITAAILFTAIGLFLLDRLRVDVVALGVLVSLGLTGILTIEETVAGFASTTVITIGALFIVGRAVFQTGLADMIGNYILRIAGTQETRLLITLMVSVAFMSAFISSTGVVALIMPAIISLSRKAGISPSRLLIPVAYSALLGGSATLIGTPPNIIAAEALGRAGFEPFGFFSFTPLSIALIIAGVLYVTLRGKRLLPDYGSGSAAERVITPAELFAVYNLPEKLTRLRIKPESPLVGQTLGRSRLRSDFRLNVVGIARASGRALLHFPNAEPRPRVLLPDGTTILQSGDVLLAQARADDAELAANYWELAPVPDAPVQENDLINTESGIAEVLLRPRSNAQGKTLADLDFGSAYGLTVLDIRRPGVEEPLDLRETPLRVGDVLLVAGRWNRIFDLKQTNRHDFIVMGEPEAAQIGAFSRTSHAPLVAVVLLVMVGVIVLDNSLLTLASLAAALTVVLTGCLSADDAYDGIDWKTIILICGMLPLSTALVKVGLIDMIAGGMSTTLGQFGPIAVLAALFLLTAVFTQVLSNTVTAVLIAPIALAAARDLGVQPQAFLISVAFAASMAFATPIASPVNTLVMSAGRYRFADYMRIGIPLIGISLVISLLLLPLLWPL